jgi:energy-coupling factor transporter ATP-binding protein EcfA2
MKFSGLSLTGWRQFEKIEIDFHPRLTIITGANGSGKSTLLRLLSQLYGWSNPLLATPNYRKSGSRFMSGLFRWLSRNEESEEISSASTVGSLTYSNGAISKIIVPEVRSVTYNVDIAEPQSIQGLHIASHRPIPAYQQVTSIPTDAIDAQKAYQSYFQETVNRYQNAYTPHSPTYRMKEAIISMATFGPGNQYVQGSSRIAELFDDFKKILEKTLPPSIGFRDISVRIPDVVIVTNTGDFVLDAASGGLMSLIDLSWQIFLYSNDKDEFVVTIDEPENHLHPSMQRAILTRLLSAFPKAQFIVATHSPFIVSSVRDSAVYVLGYNPSDNPYETGIFSRISSLKLDAANKAGTASEILRDVLGVPVTLPEWAEDDLRRISGEFQIEALDSERISQLRQRLDEAGLGEYYPEALRQIAGAP